MLTIRPYQPTDFEACVAIFDSNTPPYFSPEERQPYISWLQEKSLDGRYFVLEYQGTIRACGGWFWEKERNYLGLSWGMVQQQYQKKGLGTALTEHRCKIAKAAYPNTPMQITTSQLTEAFYERMGFVTQKITPNDFALGLHRHDMMTVTDTPA